MYEEGTIKVNALYPLNKGQGQEQVKQGQRTKMLQECHVTSLICHFERTTRRWHSFSGLTPGKVKRSNKLGQLLKFKTFFQRHAFLIHFSQDSKTVINFDVDP